MTIRVRITHEDIHSERSLAVKVMSNPDTVDHENEVCPGQSGEFFVHAGQYLLVGEIGPVEDTGEVPADADPVAEVVAAPVVKPAAKRK